MPERRATKQDRAGTGAMVGGAAVEAIAVYLYQVMSTRSLGTEAFAPIGVLWTVTFLAFTIAMIPVEQYVTRRIVGDDGSADGLRTSRLAIGGVFALAIAIGAGFVAFTLELFFEGNAWWIAVAAVLLVNRSVWALARGYLAGRWRFVSYGLAAVLESMALLAMGLVAAAVAPNALAFSLAMAFSPLAVLALRPFRSATTIPKPIRRALVGGGIGFLGFYVVASAASQLVVAGGPIVVGLIGGTSTAVSIYFVTFTLFRGPITSSYSLIARVLPSFTRLAEEGEDGQLAVWSRRFFIGGLLLGAAGFVAAGSIGPWIITVLYGSEFAPGNAAAALGGAAVGFGLAALFSGQVLVGRARTGLLASSWLVGLLAAGVTVLIVDTDAVTRVAAGFASGELTALLVLTILGLCAAQSHR